MNPTFDDLLLILNGLIEKKTRVKALRSSLGC